MTIKILKANVDIGALDPTIDIFLNIEYYETIQLPMSISGKILTYDGKIVGLLNEYDINTSDYNIKLKALESSEKNKIYQNNNQTRSYYTKLSSQLSMKAIDYIEFQREKTNDKSVKLKIALLIKTFEFDSINTSTKNVNIILPEYNLSIRKHSLDLIIKQSDWINDYAPYLGIGNFLIVELRIPNVIKVDPFWKDLYERHSLRAKEMEESLRNGDWKKTMFSGRQFFENIKVGDKKEFHKEFEEKLKELFEEDQHSEEGFKNFLNGIWQFFEFVSKYIHDKGTDAKLKPIPIPTKEDAYFAYSLAIGILNIVGKKTEKKPS